jgi:hypothetical protein
MTIPTTGWKLVGVKHAGGTTISTYIHTTPGPVRLKDWCGNQYLLNGKLVA